MNKTTAGQWKGFLLSLLVLLIVGLAVAVFIGLSLIGAGWAWIFVAFFGGIIIFLLVARTPLERKILPALEILFPIIVKLREKARKRFEYRAVVDKMEYTIEFYQLWRRVVPESCEQTKDGFTTFSNLFREELVQLLLEKTDQTNLIDHCAERTAQQFDPPISTDVLALLYQDRHGPSTEVRYKKIKEDEDLLKELAITLDNSDRLPDRIDLTEAGELPDNNISLERGHLPAAKFGFPYTIGDITLILSDIEAFSLREIRREMYKLQRVWEIASGYMAFLVQNKALPEDYSFQVSDVLASLITDEETFPKGVKLQEKLAEPERAMLRVLLNNGQAALKKQYGNLEKSERRCLNLTGLAMFFTDKRRDCLDLKAKVCWAASEEKTAVYQHQAYLEYQEDLWGRGEIGGLPFVSVAHVAENWKDTVKDRQKKLEAGFDKEIKIIQENLAKGSWWTRLPESIEKTLEKFTESMKKEIDRAAQVVTARPAVGEILHRIFRGLKLETIERFLEARTITAYLLTFDGLEGSLASLVDCLSYFKGAKYRSLLEEKGVQFRFENNEKYIFEDYISHSRIGLIPMGMPFNEFYRAFEEDLAIAYKHRDELGLANSEIDQFEMIIHRFGLSRRERHDFSKFEEEHQRKHALPKIRELFSSSLFTGDIASLIYYEQAAAEAKIEIEPIIDEILSLGSIKDFLGGRIVRLSPVQSETLSAKDYELKRDLRKEMDCDTLRKLANTVYQDAEERSDATDILTYLIFALPEFSKNKRQSKRIANNYIETLADIASIYG